MRKIQKQEARKKNNTVVDRVLSRILERSGGLGGIKGLSRTLAVMDSNGDRRLTKEELK